MATSGTFVFNPTLAEAIDDAWERAGLNPENITARHARSIVRSIDYMLSHWPNRGVLQWTVDLQEHTVTQGEQFFTPPAGTIDLLDVTIKRDGYETPMTVMSRQDYHEMPKKDQEGMPNRFFVERTITPKVYFWPAAENNTDVIRYYRIRRIEDGGALANTADIPSRWQDAFVSGVAARIAEKFNRPLYNELAVNAERIFQQARMEDRERADVVIRTRQGTWRGRR